MFDAPGTTPHVLRIMYLTMLILVAFFLRLYHLDFQSLWRDEVDAIRFSSDPFLTFDSLQATFNILTQQGHNGPLYFIFLRGWRAVVGDSEFALRYFSVIPGVLTVVLIDRLAQLLKLPAAAGSLGALLVATSPYFIWYAQEVKMYTWLVCVILMAVYAYQAALTAGARGYWAKTKGYWARTGNRWWVIFVVLTSLSFYIHILAPLMLVVYIVWAAIQWPRVKKCLGRWLGAMSALTIPYAPLFWWQMPLLLERYDSGHPFYPFLQQMSLLLHFYSVGILRIPFSSYAIWLTVFLGIVGLTGGLLGSHHVTRRIPTRLVLQIGLWFIIPPMLVYIISLQVTVFEDRYLIYILPAYYLLIALGVVIVAAQTRLMAVGLVVCVLVFHLRGTWLQASQVIKADFRAAAHYIAQAPLQKPITPPPHIAANPAVSQTSIVYLPLLYGTLPPPTVMFQMPYLQHTFDYYFAEPYRPLDGLWTNDQRDPEQVAQEMTQLTAGLGQLWLVVSEEAYWDRRHLVRDWLNRHGTVVDDAHFVGVDVYLYRLREGE